jgi:hypothetical protein
MEMHPPGRLVFARRLKRLIRTTKCAGREKWEVSWDAVYVEPSEVIDEVRVRCCVGQSHCILLSALKLGRGLLALKTASKMPKWNCHCREITLAACAPRHGDHFFC